VKKKKSFKRIHDINVGMRIWWRRGKVRSFFAFNQPSFEVVKRPIRRRLKGNRMHNETLGKAFLAAKLWEGRTDDFYLVEESIVERGGGSRRA